VLNDKLNFVTPTDGFLLFTASHVLANKLTGQNYKDFLENNIPDFLADMPLLIH
jgi:hypothetical protein